jgi:hypothetical protein
LLNLPGFIKQQEKNLRDLKWNPAGFFILGSIVMTVTKKENEAGCPYCIIHIDPTEEN